MRRGSEDIEFSLPARMEKLLGGLSSYYAKHKKSLLQRVVVNATYDVEAGWNYDNWNGGTWGHLVHLRVPGVVFYEAFDSKSDVEKTVGDDLNRLADVPNEYVARVSLELRDDSASDGWREKSGALLRGPVASTVSENRVSHLWEPGFLRVFLSYTSVHKKEAGDLKGPLVSFGASCFVTHEDIHPTKEWQGEIELALFSMEVMVPLLTEGFKESNWTDQEVGVAIGRGIPVVPVRLGKDPYGFIGKYQAVAGHGKTPRTLAGNLMDVFLGNPSLKEQAIQALVRRFEDAENFVHANALMHWLEKIEVASPNIIERLEKAPESNRQVADAFGVRERLPRLLKRLKG
jgi:hypothetical protein